MLRLLFITLIAASCAKVEPQKATAAKRPINLDTSMIQALNAFDYNVAPDTFTMFFFPEVGTMSWDSNVFDKNKSDEDKLTDIIANVISMSNKIDDVMLNSYQLDLRNQKLNELKKTKGCDSSDDDFGDIDDLDLKELNLDSDDELTCEQIDQEIYQNSELITDSSTLVSMHLDEIQKSVDNPNKAQSVNWFDYGDPNSYKVILFSEDSQGNQVYKPSIYFDSLGHGANSFSYSSESGEIFDIEYVNSEYAPNTMMLKFKVKEKDDDGLENGNIWDAELEQISFAGKQRFSGDLIRYDSLGNVIQKGVMKFEMTLKSNNDDDIGDIGDDFGDDLGDDFGDDLGI